MKRPGTFPTRSGPYRTAHDAFAAAMAAYSDPLTRTKAALLTLDAAKLTLQYFARGFGKMIQANPGLSDAQKEGMGTTIRATPLPRPVPQTAPVLEIVSATGWQVKFRLKATAGGKRGKPKSATGATILSHVGSLPPADRTQFKFEGNTGQTEGTVVFPSTLAPGTTVWLTAFWIGGGFRSGPACQPVSTNLLGSGSALLAA